MIQQREVCICDICGHVEVAQENPGQYNDVFYTAPAVITDSLTQSFAQRLQGSLGENLTADSVTKRE